VVVHGNAERLGRVDDLLGHLDVGARRRRVTGRMVVELPSAGIYLIEIYSKNSYFLKHEGRLLGAGLMLLPT
jgi:hypothetical protein